MSPTHRSARRSARPQAADLDDAAVPALRDLLLAGMQFRVLVAEQFGIDLSASVALSHLSARGPLSARDLAHLVGVTPSSMTALLDRLEAQDLARRGRHPTDRRKTVATITPHGEQTLVQVRQWMAEALDSVDADLLPDPAAALTALAQALDAQSAAIRETAGTAH